MIGKCQCCGIAGNGGIVEIYCIAAQIQVIPGLRGTAQIISDIGSRQQVAFERGVGSAKHRSIAGVLNANCNWSTSGHSDIAES